MDTILIGIMIAIIAGWILRALFMITHFDFKALELKPCLESPTSYQSFPKISILVPAKNEEKNLPNCLDSLVNQNYPNFEIIVADDRSTDKTPEILETYQKKYSDKIRFIRIEQLPSDWAGKNHALHQAFQVALGEWILFTDADTIHKPGCLLSVYNYVFQNKVDFLTLSPQFINLTLFEKMLQPVAGAILGLWFPWKQINDDASDRFFGNGQFLFMRRNVYEKIGGHAAIKNIVLEDMLLAQKIKQSGFKSRIAAGQQIFAVRMYDSFRRFWMGWRGIFTEIVDRKMNQLLLMIGSAIFFSILPFLIFAFALIEGFYFNSWSTTLLLLSFICSAIIILVNKKVYQISQSNFLFALLHPINVGFIVIILIDGIFFVSRGHQKDWRGMRFPTKKSTASSIS